MPTPSLKILAGRSALELIRREGLRPDQIAAVAGAAGGPKFLVLSQLDRVVFGELLRERREPLFLLGSSIGSWRFAALSRRDPLRAIEELERLYIGQRYPDRPTAADVTRELGGILDQVVTPQAIEEILSHPWHRLNIVAARARSLVDFEHRTPLTLALGLALGANAIHRSTLHAFFRRTIFSDSRATPGFLRSPLYPNDTIHLTHQNLRDALLASGSIPVVMSGVQDIAGARPGTYWDGGIIDYHMNIPWGGSHPHGKIILFPHFGPRIIPGWFDKSLPWKKPDLRLLDDVLLIAPSDEFVKERLPGGKIPDRTDFRRYFHQDEARMAAWRQVVSECGRLAEELHELLTRGDIASRVQPIETGLGNA